MLWLIDISLAFLVIFNLVIHRDVAYPGFLQAFIWFAACLMFTFYQGRFIDVGTKTLLLILGGVMLFSIGSLLATFRHKPYLQRNYVRLDGLPRRLPMLILLAIVSAGIVAFAYKAMTLSSLGTTDNSFVNLRSSVTTTRSETGGFGMLAYLIPIANFLAAAAIIKFYGYKKPALTKKLVAVTVLLAAGYAFLSSGRSYFVILLIVIFAILMLLRVKHLLPVALAFGALSIATFVVGGLLLNKGGSLDQGIAANAASMYDTGIVYTLGSIPALGSALDSTQELTLGTNTFRTFYSAMNRAGIDVEAAPLVQEFTTVPMLTNLYTVYYPYLRDFGLIGAMLFQLLFGLIHGFLYRKATVYQPSAFYVFMFAITLMALTSQLGGDGYFSMLSTWIQYLLYGSIFMLLPIRQPAIAMEPAV